jgi:hypothetical protein
MKNGNQELEIEIVDFITEIVYRDAYMNEKVTGWSGSARINGHLYTGDFAMVENYDIQNEDGEIDSYQINWSELI